MKKPLSCKLGCTLIELLIVIAIIGLLSTLAIPAYLNLSANSYELTNRLTIQTKQKLELLKSIQNE